MAKTTWSIGTSGDWNTATDWSPNVVPNGNTASVVVPGAASAYTVSIGAGESEIVNTVTVGDLLKAHVGPTLEIAGTLTFGGSSPSMDFLSGAIQIDAAGMLAGKANIGAIQGPGVGVINDGTVLGNSGASTLLGILVGFTNNGTVLATSGGVVIEGAAGLSNLAGNTLTGGTWIAQGLTAGKVNQIELGYNFDADIAVDAANIVLDGQASDISGYIGATGTAGSGANFQSIEQQLQSIAATGTLQLLDNRGYTTTNTLDDGGLLILQGSSLATGGLTIDAAGTFEGLGIVAGAVSNQGNILVEGGALDFIGTLSGTGSLTTGAGSSLILAGASPSAITNDGVIYNTAGLLDIGALSGNGTLVVEGGSAIEIGGTTSQSIVFAGSDAEVILDAPTLFSGTLAGFDHGDKLVVIGLSADAATVVNGDTLAVMSSGTTVATYNLAGNYTGATFSAKTVGGFALITNISGAPARDDMPFAISMKDTSGLLNAAQQAAIENDLSAAALDWAQFITGHTTLRIQLNITHAAHGSELATGGFATSIASGQTLGGETVVVPSSIYALTTGNYIPGSTADVVITLPLSTGELDSANGLYAAPDPVNSGDAVPSNEFDLVSVFRHELAHGLGFSGLTMASGAIGANETMFDQYIQQTATSANFVGPNAEAAYGAFLGTNAPTPVPLTLLNNGENFFHFANSSTDPLAQDLMSGLGIGKGQQRDISSVDIAVLQDVGAPVTATAVCYARGTRIATPQGEVPIEFLNVGDDVRTLSCRQRIIWIGRRRIDCRRHPDPRKIWPVRIRAHAFGEGLPQRDLFVSPQHALYLNGVLIPARCLIDNDYVTQLAVESVEYFHIELPHHDVVLAEGLPAESYLDVGDRMSFDNGGAVIALHPEFADRVWESRACAPLKVAGPEVEAVRRLNFVNLPGRKAA